MHGLQRLCGNLPERAVRADAGQPPPGGAVQITAGGRPGAGTLPSCLHRLRPLLGEAISQYRTRVPTRKVNDLIRRAQQAQPAPHGARILYATQGATDPPTFTLFVSKDVPASYLRYIERQIQEEFDLGSTPIKLRVRRRGD